MQIKMLVGVVAAAFAVPTAYAQKGGGGGSKEGPEPDSSVVIYGKVYPEIVFPSSSGATSTSAAAGANAAGYCTICIRPAGENGVTKKSEFESSNSRLGFRGFERLGGDLRAIFQLETEFHVDDVDSRFAGRDSFVGLSSKRWGTVKLGRMDTPFKEYGDDISFLGVSSGNFTSTSSVFRHIGMGGQNNAARFHERRINVVQYESPDLGPVDFKVQWSTNEAKTDTPPLRDPRVFSSGARIELGNFEVYGGYEVHWDLFGLSLNALSAQRNTNDPNVRSKDEAVEIGVKYKLGRNHQFAIEGNKKKYDEPGATATGKVRSYENEAYLFAWDARWSEQWRTAVQYVRAQAGECQLVNAACNTNGLKGEQFGVGVAYHFSRRTYLFLMGTLVKNDFAASFNNSNQQDVNPGEDLRQVAIGIHTAF